MISSYGITENIRPGSGIYGRLAKTLSSALMLLIFLGVITTGSARGGVDAVNDSIPGPPPGTYKILSEDGSIKVPFRLHRGDVLMTCMLNGRPVRLMIDNGFLWDEILLFGSPTIDSIGLDYDGEIGVGGSASGDAVKSKTAGGITLTYDDVEFYDQSAIVTPYSAGMGDMWTGTDGQISATFLKHFVVRFDFDEMVMTLTPPDKFEYTGGGAELPIEHHLNNSWLVPATVVTLDGRRVDLGLMMDLGYGSYLELVEDGPHRFEAPEGSIPGSLGAGIGGATMGSFGRIASLEIGGYVIDDLLTAFAPEEESEKEFHETLLGLGLLSKFNFIYDYPGRRMFIEPNSDFDTPTEYDMTGLTLRKRPGGYVEVTGVHPGSPAAEKGFSTGDRVLTINGREAAGYDVWELRPLFRREGEKVVFTVSRGGVESEITLVLRRLV